jgi:hypothetical protein
MDFLVMAKKGDKEVGMEKSDQVIQEFPRRCPYCGEPVSYDRIALKTGENKILCPSCKKTYIKVVSDSTVEGETG